MVPDRYVRASDFNGKLGQANNPEWKTVAFDESGKVVLPQGAIGFRWGPDGRADQGQWNLEAKEARHGKDVKLKLSVLEGEQPSTETAKVGFPYFGGIESAKFPEQRARATAATCWCAPCRSSASRSARKARNASALVATVFDLQVANYGVARGLAGECAAARLRRRHALHAGLAGAHHRHAARAADHRGAPVRRERPQDARQVDGDHRRGDEPLVPQRHELPRRHQHADDVRLHRPERRRLGALRGPGEAAAADRLDRAGLCARLDPPAAADEQHQLLLRPHRPVALREARHGRGAVAAGRQEALWPAA